MAISATQVKTLRDKTGVSMGDCKQALVDANGDEKQAIEILQKRYAGKLGIRADKEAANGRIGAYTDGTVGALIELRCETDFVAGNADFKAAADEIAQIAAQSGLTDTESLMNAKGPDGKTVKEILTTAYGKLQENMVLKRAVLLQKAAAHYVHHNGKIGTLVAADKTGVETARHICMHVAAQPVLLGLKREHVNPEEVQKARDLMADEVKNKPPQIQEKIVSGKMDKWFGERVLLEQPFAMDDKKTVAQVATESGIAVLGYLKMELGGK